MKILSIMIVAALISATACTAAYADSVMVLRQGLLGIGIITYVRQVQPVMRAVPMRRARQNIIYRRVYRKGFRDGYRQGYRDGYEDAYYE